jgi:hypothetical protein
MVLRSDLSNIRRPNAPAATAAATPDLSSLEEHEDGEQLPPSEPVVQVDEPAPTRRSVVKEVEETVETVVSDAERKLRTALADVEADIAKLKAQFGAKLEALRSKHVDLSTKLTEHLFK